MSPRTHQNARLLTNRSSEIEPDRSSLLPLDCADHVSKRVESVLDDIKRMRVDELRWFVRDGRRAVVHLQMDRPEVVVRVVLVPADQQTSVWLDPVEPMYSCGSPVCN